MAKSFSELEEAGVQLALDDFGTGYSSLVSLKRFDVRSLKIDQSFVWEDGKNTNHRTIAETIIMMAHELGLQVVSEGVETAEQRDWFKATGCDFAQGFFFSEPVPVLEFERLLRVGHLNR